MACFTSFANNKWLASFFNMLASFVDAGTPLWELKKMENKLISQVQSPTPITLLSTFVSKTKIENQRTRFCKTCDGVGCTVDVQHCSRGVSTWTSKNIQPVSVSSLYTISFNLWDNLQWKQRKQYLRILVVPVAVIKRYCSSCCCGCRYQMQQHQQHQQYRQNPGGLNKMHEYIFIW